MKYEVEYLQKVVEKDIPALPKSMRDRVQSAIETKLITQPDTFGKPLHRSLRGYRSLRVGEYRVLFRLDKSIVVVVAIGHRSIIYTDYENRFI